MITQHFWNVPNVSNDLQTHVLVFISLLHVLCSILELGETPNRHHGRPPKPSAVAPRNHPEKLTSKTLTRIYSFYRCRAASTEVPRAASPAWKPIFLSLIRHSPFPMGFWPVFSTIDLVQSLRTPGPIPYTSISWDFFP